MNLALYQLADLYRVALSEIPDDASEEEIGTALKALEGAIAEKGQNIVAYCLNLSAEAAAIEAAAERLKAKASVIKRRQEGLKGYLFSNMKILGITEIKANDGTFRAKIIKNPPAVEIIGEIPAEYEKVIPEQRVPDKNKIKEDLKAGVIVPGANLVQGERLDIK